MRYGFFVLIEEHGDQWRNKSRIFFGDVDDGGILFLGTCRVRERDRRTFGFLVDGDDDQRHHYQVDVELMMMVVGYIYAKPPTPHSHIRGERDDMSS